MHCPKCGTPAAEVQKFCRSCGFGLEKVALLVEGSSPTVKSDSADENPDRLHDLLNRMEQMWQAGLVLLGGAFVATVCWGIIDKIIIEKGHVISGSIFLFFILGLVSLGLSGWYIESQRKKLAGRQKRQPNPQLSASQLSDVLPNGPPDTLNADTTNKLLPEPDLSSVASVTEETTARLAEKINAAR